MYQLKCTNPDYIEYYNHYKRVYSRVIQHAKKMQNDGLYINSSNKSKAAWSIINNTVSNHKRKTKHIEKIVTDGKIVRNASKIAEMLNNHFKDIPLQAASNLKIDGNGFSINQGNTCM